MNDESHTAEGSNAPQASADATPRRKVPMIAVAGCAAMMVLCCVLGIVGNVLAAREREERTGPAAVARAVADRLRAKAADFDRDAKATQNEVERKYNENCRDEMQSLATRITVKADQGTLTEPTLIEALTDEVVAADSAILEKIRAQTSAVDPEWKEALEWLAETQAAWTNSRDARRNEVADLVSAARRKLQDEYDAARGRLTASEREEMRQLGSRLAEPRPSDSGAQTQRAGSREEVLGPRPENNGWNGAVQEVADYIKSHAHDPDSIEWDRWTEPHGVRRAGEVYWGIRVIYRGKNALGALVRQDQMFYMRHGRVVLAEGYDDAQRVTTPLD